MDTDHTPRASEKTAWFLLAGLGLFIIILIFLLVNYQPLRAAYILPPATRTHTPSPTASTTPVLTSTRTSRPTWTLGPTDTLTIEPTSTSTPTSTRLALATLTPALPYKFNERYDLAAPSSELANRITILMRQIPDLLYHTPEERKLPLYHQAYKYAAFAYREALLRYPDAPESGDWRWGLAFSQAQIGDPAASTSYTLLVKEALRDTGIPIASLADWFHTKEPGLSMSVHSFEDPSGSAKYLLEIQPGEMYLLVQEYSDKMEVYTLFDTFIYDAEIPSIFYYGNLTGDGSAELAFYRQAAQDTRLHDPIIFNLTDITIYRLPVEETVPLDFRMGFTPAMNCPDCVSGSQVGHFQLSASIFPACPILAVRSYQWDGGMFRSQPLAFSAQPVADSLAYCETIKTHAADFLPASANMALLLALQPLWPPPLDLGGRLYPPDSQSSLTFQLGIFQALAGDSAGATQTLQNLANQNVKAWSSAASQFLKEYNGGPGLYRACLAAVECSPGKALQQVLLVNSPKDLDEALRLLWDSGLSTAADGVFDFNRDGQVERWFTLRARPGQALEFWIMTLTSTGVQAIPVDFVEESKPPIFFSIAFPGDSVFQFEPKRGYALRLTKESREPYIEEYVVEPVLTTYTRDQLAAAERDLFSGIPATEIRAWLENVLSSGRFNCLNGRICDRFYYLLGLTYELSGRDRDAIDTYIKLWWENKNSPFTTMARSKLIFNAPVTPGPSPTTTKTVTRTPTPGPSPTAGPSPTEEPYPYPEPTDITPYPYPYP
jgi:hypothetical protein